MENTTNYTYEWYKENIEPYMSGYEVTYRHYNDGDFGSLDQIAFDKYNDDQKKDYIRGGGIDFWSSGVLQMDMNDFRKGNDFILNTWIFPDDENAEEEKGKAFDKLIEILKSYNVD